MGAKLRIMLAAASVCALVLVVSLATFSQAGGGGRTVITVVEHATNEAEADSDGDGADSSGDIFWFSNPVYDDSDNKVVGHDLGTCIRIDPSAGSWHCTWTTFLADGQLVVSGPFYDTRSSVLAILGGTGEYLGAAGSMLLSKGYTDHGVFKYTFTFRLSP